MEKIPVAPYETRLQWIQQLFKDDIFSISDFEKDSSQTIFASQIFAHLRLEEPEADYVWILGEDQFDQLAYWKNINEYADKLSWLVMPRRSESRKAGIFSKRLLASSCSYEWAYFLSDRSVISSSEIRSQLSESNKKDIEDWVPSEIREDVYEIYSKANGTG